MLIGFCMPLSSVINGCMFINLFLESTILSFFALIDPTACISYDYSLIVPFLVSEAVYVLSSVVPYMWILFDWLSLLSVFLFGTLFFFLSFVSGTVSYYRSSIWCSGSGTNITSYENWSSESVERMNSGTRLSFELSCYALGSFNRPWGFELEDACF